MGRQRRTANRNRESYTMYSNKVSSLPQRTTSIEKRRHRIASKSIQVKRRLLALAVATGFAVFSSGCTRTYHRTRADAETGVLISQKVDAAQVDTIRNVQVDRASRMFDPFNPDRPPMPEDDPTAHRYMRIIDGKKHYPLWYVNGRTNLAESPDWWQFLPLDERGVLVLDMDQSVRIALLNSPDYQENLETLYLSALDVSTERFLLDNQFFGGYSASIDSSGPARRGNGGESSTVVSTGVFSRGDRPLGFSRSLSTGATFAAGLANSLTWQLSGPDTQSANTILDFSLFQPLLRGAGRDVVLERLTLAERTLLANVRAYERYRVGFALTVTAGRAEETGPNRRGGLFGGAGLQGFTGLGGGFGTVGNAGGGGGGGFGAASTVPSAGGYLGLLQDQLEIRNTLENTARLRDVLLQFEDQLNEQLTKIPETQQTIPQQELQVAQARQALINAQNTLLNLQTAYELSLDQFKRTLGLPPYICVEIRDPLLDQFNIVSTEMLTRRNEISTLRETVGRNNTELLGLSEIVNDDDGIGSYRILPIDEEVQELLTQQYNNVKRTKTILNSLKENDIPQIRGDLQRLEGQLGERSAQLARLRQILREERDAICAILPTKGLDAALLQDEELVKLPAILELEIGRVEQRLKKYTDQYEKLLVDIEKLASEKVAPPLEQPDRKLPANNKARLQFEEIRDNAILQSQEILAAISDEILALQVIQARARTESIVLPEVDITPREAIDIARVNRLDWINNRASLVDQWRSIEVVADQLESFLDVTFSGDIQNSNDNPFSFRNNTGRLRAGLQWDSPLTRLQERNQYRQVLIEYQQAKRTFYRYEDSVWTTLRNELRSIRLNQFNFELQRYAVRIAAQQITLNGDIRAIGEALQQPAGPTAARDSIQALGALLDAQNTLIGVWVNYEAQRRNLNQDLGTARVDGEGMWVDPGPITSTNISPAMMMGGMVEGTPFDLQPVVPEIEGNALPEVSVAPMDQTNSEPLNLDQRGPVVPEAVLPAEPN